MKPPKRDKTEFERIEEYDEWIEGTITDVEYNEKYTRKFNGEEKTGPACRFKFGLKGYEFPKRSRWLTFSYADKSNLYKNFISVLVEDAEPDMDFDLDELKGFSGKTMWTQAEDFDKLPMIRPLANKFGAKGAADPGENTEEVPF